MWTPLREDIARIQAACQLPSADFSALPMTTGWARVEAKIYHTFCVLEHPVVRPLWLWGAFRPGAYALANEADPLGTMIGLVEPDEVVWLMVNDSLPAGDKFWFYQGKPAAIHTVLRESTYLDEIYLLSKKYAWLLCLNHHDILYGIGSPIGEKLQALGARPVVYQR
ncbi:DUF6756 family protein [Hymenobacter sp. HD11105]